MPSASESDERSTRWAARSPHDPSRPSLFVTYFCSLRQAVPLSASFSFWAEPTLSPPLRPTPRRPLLLSFHLSCRSLTRATRLSKSRLRRRPPSISGNREGHKVLPRRRSGTLALHAEEKECIDQSVSGIAHTLGQLTERRLGARAAVSQNVTCDDAEERNRLVGRISPVECVT